MKQAPEILTLPFPFSDFRDFTLDRNTYSDYPDFINNLTALGQRWIPIVDAAIPATPLNESDIYLPGETGNELDVFIKDDNGTDYIGGYLDGRFGCVVVLMLSLSSSGIVWPGPAKFLDNHGDNAQKWLSAAYNNFSQLANFSGVWLDMNEPSSFIVGSAVDPDRLNASKTAHVASTFANGWPEGYCNQTWGTSGNISVRGTKTFSNDCLDTEFQEQAKRSEMPLYQEMLPRSHVRDIMMARRQDESPSDDNDDFHYSPAKFVYKNVKERVLHDPPYAIHNGIMSSEGPLVDNLNKKTVAMDSVTKLGKFYDVHNIDGKWYGMQRWMDSHTHSFLSSGTMLGMRTHNALKELRPDERPFIVGRSTYSGAGKYVSHWLGGKCRD